MSSDLLLISTALAHRRKTAPPEVSPKSSAATTNGAFHRCCPSIFPLSNPQTALFPAFRIPQNRLNLIQIA
jgi:hypothetical protein